MDVRAAEAVAEARRVQRHQLARDLHDFVAHDVSAMVLQAQAARVVLDAEPPRAAEALRRIETDGTRALDAMDRSIQLLRLEDSEAVTSSKLEPVPGLDQLTELIERFAADHPGTVELWLECRPDDVPRDISTVVYRVVVEALTNVRRHASAHCDVDITVQLVDNDGRTVECVIANTMPAGSPPLPRQNGSGGTGLAALAELSSALGGRFTAGPGSTPKWTVTATLPLPQQEPR